MINVWDLARLCFAVTFMSYVLALSGCARAKVKTPHEACTDPELVSRYKDYDQCFQAELLLRAKQTKCYTQGFGRNAVTTCK
jgi:hypothetical protein